VEALAAWLGERAVAIRAALSQLPAPQRQMIEMAVFDGLTQAEIAAAMGDPRTIKSRIRIGMQRLRDVLLAAGIDEVS
jgi:RNA polymerase sigma-70 factor (ECF subfamily)